MEIRTVITHLSVGVLCMGMLACAAAVGGVAEARLGWDLSYESLLHENAVGRGAWLSKWLRRHKAAPIRSVLEGWSHDAIESAILLDVPAPHAAERVALFLVRTRSGAYVWVYTDGEPEEAQDKPIDAALYDKFFAESLAWEQAPPLSKEQAGDDVPAGYFGVLSTYAVDRSRQMLLTYGDFHVPGPHGWKDPRDGRLSVALGPIAETYE